MEGVEYWHPFCTTLDLQRTFCRPLFYNSRAHCPLLQCLHTTSPILAGVHSYFAVSSFKCEGENSWHDLIPNPCKYELLRTGLCIKEIQLCRGIQTWSRRERLIPSNITDTWAFQAAVMSVKLFNTISISSAWIMYATVITAEWLHPYVSFSDHAL